MMKKLHSYIATYIGLSVHSDEYARRVCCAENERARERLEKAGTLAHISREVCLLDVTFSGVELFRDPLVVSVGLYYDDEDYNAARERCRRKRGASDPCNLSLFAAPAYGSVSRKLDRQIYAFANLLD